MQLYVFTLSLLLYTHPIPTSPTKVWITPHSAYLSSTLNLTQAYQDLSQANTTIITLEQDYLDKADITYETKKLVEIVIKTGTLKMERILNLMHKHKEYHLGRRKRDTVNPLYGVGNIADWAFGLTSHERFTKVKKSVQDSLDMLDMDSQEVNQNVRDNTKAIGESVEALREFEKVLNNLKENDDKLLKTDRLFLKIIRYKFELDFYLNSLSRFSLLVSEVLDQSDLGFASRHLFSPEFLRNAIIQLNERFANLSPVFGSDKVDSYFILPLSLSSYDGASVHSILKIPMMDEDAQFTISHQNFQEGFITLKSFNYKIMMSFFQFKKCSRKNQNNEILCFFRPCLVKIESSQFICFALNETNFIISTGHNISLTTLCGEQVSKIQVPQSRSYSHLAIPRHCQVQSQHFIIRNIQTPSSTSQDTPSVNTILSMDQTSIIINTSSTDHQTLINLDTSHILLQLNQTQPIDKPAIPAHYEPLTIGGAAIGTTAMVLTAVLGIWGVRRIKRRKEMEKEELKERKNPNTKDNNEQEPLTDTKMIADDETNSPNQTSPPSDKIVTDDLPAYKLECYLDKSEVTKPLSSFTPSMSSFSHSSEYQPRSPFCGLLELRCDEPDNNDTLNLCKDCQEIKKFANETAFTDTTMGGKIDQNLKHSLNLPLNIPVKIWPYDDGTHTIHTVFLQFAMNITYTEHEDMMTSQQRLMKDMTESHTDRVYLHGPAQIKHHSLSLYKIN